MIFSNQAQGQIIGVNINYKSTNYLSFWTKFAEYPDQQPTLQKPLNSILFKRQLTPQ